MLSSDSECFKYNIVIAFKKLNFYALYLFKINTLLKNFNNFAGCKRLLLHKNSLKKINY